MKNRRCSNEVPIEMMLGCEQPAGFSFEIKGCVGTASVGEWKKKGMSREL